MHIIVLNCSALEKNNISEKQKKKKIYNNQRSFRILLVQITFPGEMIKMFIPQGGWTVFRLENVKRTLVDWVKKHQYTNKLHLQH